ncbi:MAG: SxtJ family membrane protein [Pseudomonadota bacterium]
MAKKEINIKKELRNFGLLIGGILGLIAIYLFWKEKSSFAYFIAFSLTSLILSLLFPFTLKYPHKFWIGLSNVISWVMTRIILIILFYLILTPIAFLAKLIRKNFLDLKIDKTIPSYWIKKENKQINISDYEKQF